MMNVDTHISNLNCIFNHLDTCDNVLLVIQKNVVSKLMGRLHTHQGIKYTP